MKRMVVFGCAGYIGSHLLDRFLESGEWLIEGWDLESQKIAHLLDHPNLDLHLVDITSPDTQARMDAAIRDADVVVGLTAICNPAEYNTRPLDVIRGNLFDLYQVVERCAEHNTWLIQFSTSEVYGRTLASYATPGSYPREDLYELDEDTTPFVLGPVSEQRWTYACAKQLLERLVVAHHAEQGLPYTIIRPLNFFGPRMDYIDGRDGEGVPRVLASFMGALLDRKPMRVVDGGAAMRTIVSIYDAVDAIELMLNQPERAQNQAFNIGNRDNEVTMLELAHRMRETYAAITGDESYLEHPIEDVSSLEFYGEGYADCDRRMPKLDKARELVGWEPKTPLDEILFDTMSDYHRRYAEAAVAG